MRFSINHQNALGGGLLVSLSIVSGALILSGLSLESSVSAEAIENTPYTISAATDGNVDILVSQTNTVTTASHDVLVSTNCLAGYNLSIYTDNEGKIYRNADTASEYYLASTTGTLEVPIVLADNQWGFSLINPATNGNKFSAVPLTATEIRKTTTATSATEADRTTVYYGVKTDGTLAAGHYTGTVIYSVMPSPDCYKYTITFDTGDGNTIEDTTITFGDTIDLAVLSAKTSKTGYKLTGWKDKTTGTTYGTTGTININPNMANSINLEAIWEANGPTITSDAMQAFADANAKYATKSSDGKMYYTMQQETSVLQTACNKMTTPNKSATTVPELTLMDTRDEQLYTIRKFADGNCWMAQNLRLVGSRTLTSADSDVSNNFSLPSPVSTFTNSSNNNQVGPVQSSYGNGAYYSWYAATAGTGTSSVTSGDAPSSVCPKGWRLPPNSGNKSYYNLITNAYGIANSSAGSTALRTQPLQFAYGGHYNGSSFNNGGSVGYYWSSTAHSSTNAYNLYFYSSGVYPQYNNHRYNGFSVRCVAR